MARPRKLGMDYFPHDCDASSDEKIEGLRALYGNDGYAFYFILLERIYRTPNFQLDLSNEDMKIILARKIDIQVDKFDKILKSALNLGCFDKSAFENEKVLTSNGIRKRAEIVVDKRLKMQKKYKENNKSKDKNSADTSQENSKETVIDTGPNIDAETSSETTGETLKDNLVKNTDITAFNSDINTSEIHKETAAKIEQENISEITPKTSSETTESKVKHSREKYSKGKNNLLMEEDYYCEDDAHKNKIKLVTDYFLEKSGRQAVDELDLKCVKDLLCYIDTNTIKLGIDMSFDRFKPKFKDDSIKTFRYCKSTILEIYNSKNEGGNFNGNSRKISNSTNNSENSIENIAEKYGLTTIEGKIQDFECQL